MLMLTSLGEPAAPPCLMFAVSISATGRPRMSVTTSILFSMASSQPKHPGGRPPVIHDGRAINVRVSRVQLAWLDAKGNRSEAIRRLIDEAIKRESARHYRRV